MQNNYTEIFNGTESADLPPGLKETQVGFEGAFARMSSLAKQLAGFEQDIREILATAKVAVSTTAGTVE